MTELSVRSWVEWATVNPVNNFPIVWESEEKARIIGESVGHKVVHRTITVTEWKADGISTI